MSAPLPRPADLKAGDEIPGVSRPLGREEIRRYNRYASGGEDTLNIHTDDETARRAGLPRALATGRHPVSFLSERLVDVFGPGFLAGGEIEVAFVKPIFPGGTVRTHIRVREIRPEAGGPEAGRRRALMDVSLIDQDGTPVTVGTASALILD